MRRLFCLLFTLCLLSSLIGCTSLKSKPEDSDSRPLIVTSVFALYDFSRVLLGDLIRIQMLIPPGSDTHSYEPTPQDIAMLGECDLFLFIGGEGDAHLRELINSVENVPALSFFESIEPLCEEEHEHTHTEEEHVHSDEHIWTSPKNAQIMLGLLCEKFQELFPEYTRILEENRISYLNELELLDADFRAFSLNAPLLAFADRFPFSHLAAEYSLRYQSAVSGCGEEAEPSVSELRALIDTVRQENLSCVFYTETSDGRIARTVCSETGVKALRLHSCHNLTEAEWSEGCTYLSLMRDNLNTLKMAQDSASA